MAGNTYIVMIDGTGPYDDQQYARDFEFSFLHQLYKSCGDSRSAYFPGPGTCGLTTRSKANTALDALHRKRESDRTCKLFVAGYSRGGAAAMEVCKMANYWTPESGGSGNYGNNAVPEVIPIEGLFLLDPVSKDVLCTGGGITQNVRRAYVMYRDQSIFEYSPAIKTEDFASFLDKGLGRAFNAAEMYDPDRYARKFMSNAPVTLAADNGRTRIIDKGVVKNASHGAIGGLPWVEYRADQNAVIWAAALLNGWLAENGIADRVEDKSFTKASMAQYPAVTAETARKLNDQRRAAAQEMARKAQHLRRGVDR